jgi:triosephosphate isomerase
MNQSISEATNFATNFQNLTEGVNLDVDYAIAAPYTLLPLLTKLDIFPVSAQNVSQHESGAFTGEISLSMLDELNVKYIIVGHSERRQYYNETDESVNEKLLTILNNSDITPIMAFGETEEQYDAGQTYDVVRKQIFEGLADIPNNQLEKIVLAYEPI